MSDASQHAGGGWYTEVPLAETERVIKASGARHRFGRIGLAPGKLFLTNQNLIWTPLKWQFPFRVEAIVLPLAEIEGIGRGTSNWKLLTGVNVDSWFIKHGGQTRWFDAGWGSNKLWLRRLAKATGLEAAHV
jgi:hypothetical protein